MQLFLTMAAAVAQRDKVNENKLKVAGFATLLSILKTIFNSIYFTDNFSIKTSWSELIKLFGIVFYNKLERL